MVGYHYTTANNWRKIKSLGLIPYEIKKEEFKSYGFKNGSCTGIWVWTSRMYGKAHIGSLLWQIATKDAFNVVLLKVNYNRNDIVQFGTFGRILQHSGAVENFVYHDGTQESVLVTKPILPIDITVVKKYYLRNIVR